MTESDPRDTSPADFAELSLAVLVARYVALRVDGDAETRSLGAAERVSAGWALDAAVPVEVGPRPGPSAGAGDAAAG